MRAVVVGGGIVGCAAARKLQDAGWDTTLVATRPAATEIAAGILLPGSSPSSCEGLQGKWNRECLLAWQGWEKVGATRGAFLFASDDASEISQAAYRAWAEEAGLATRLLTAADTHLPLSGEIIKQTRSVLSIPDARTVRTESILPQLRSRLRIVPERALELVMLGGRVSALRTEHSLLRADIVVAACGWGDWHWSPVRPDLLPWQGERVLFGGFSHQIPLVQTGAGPLVGRGDGKLWAGVSFREDASGLPRADAIRDIIERALRWLPDLGDAHIVSIGAGIRPGSRDGLPLLGETEIEGLYFSTGHGRGGILGAPLSAEILMQIIEGRASAWQEHLLPGR